MKHRLSVFLLLAAFACTLHVHYVLAQNPGKQGPNQYPQLSTSKCTNDRPDADAAGVVENNLVSSSLAYTTCSIDAGEMLGFFMRLTSGNPTKAAIYGNGDMEIIKR